jgi:hypothetical protein
LRTVQHNTYVRARMLVPGSLKRGKDEYGDDQMQKRGAKVESGASNAEDLRLLTRGLGLHARAVDAGVSRLEEMTKGIVPMFERAAAAVCEEADVVLRTVVAWHNRGMSTLHASKSGADKELGYLAEDAEGTASHLEAGAAAAVVNATVADSTVIFDAWSHVASAELPPVAVRAPFGVEPGLLAADLVGSRLVTGEPDASKSEIGGPGLSLFTHGQPAEIIVTPCAFDGSPVEYVREFDIKVSATDALGNAVDMTVKTTRTHADAFSWKLLYTVADPDIKYLKLHVSVDGVSMVALGGTPVYATFNYKRAQLQGQYELCMPGPARAVNTMAVNATGTNVAAWWQYREAVIYVYSICAKTGELEALPALKQDAAAPDKLGVVLGVCFTDDNTLLIVDHVPREYMYRLCHSALDGTPLASPIVLSRYSHAGLVASHGDVVAIGEDSDFRRSAAVCLRSRSGGNVVKSWPIEISPNAILFINASTLGVSGYATAPNMTTTSVAMICLYDLDGACLRKIIPEATYEPFARVLGLSACADGCLLISLLMDEATKRMVYAYDPHGDEQPVPFNAVFKDAWNPYSIAVRGPYVYVFCTNYQGTHSRLFVFA